MNAKSLSPGWQDLALALGLGLGLIIAAAGVVRADTTGQPQTVTGQVASAPQIPANFVCHAQPGGWCDLRDWSGMDHWSNEQLSDLPR